MYKSDSYFTFIENNVMCDIKILGKKSRQLNANNNNIYYVFISININPFIIFWFLIIDGLPILFWI